MPVQSPLIYEVPREGNFAPVKNAEGQDSPATSREALIRYHRRSLEKVGLHVDPERAVEVSFRLTHNKEALERSFRGGDAPLIIG